MAFAGCRNIVDALLLVNNLGITSGTLQISSPKVHGWILFRGRSIVRAFAFESNQSGKAALHLLTATSAPSFSYLPSEEEVDSEGTEQPLKNIASKAFADKVVMREEGRVIVFRLPQFDNELKETFATPSDTSVEESASKFARSARDQFTPEDYDPEYTAQALEECGFTTGFSDTANSAKIRALSTEEISEARKEAAEYKMVGLAAAALCLGISAMFFMTKGEEARSIVTPPTVSPPVALRIPSVTPSKEAANKPAKVVVSPDPAMQMESTWLKNRRDAITLEKAIRMYLSRRNMKRARLLAEFGFRSPYFTPQQRAMFYQLYHQATKLT